MQWPDLAYDTILCRYSEIAMKKRNRRQFEECLVAGLRRCLTPLGTLRSRRDRGRIFLRYRDDSAFSPADCQLLRQRLAHVFGLASASPGFGIAPELTAIEATIDHSFAAVYSAVAASIADQRPIRYAMRARRSNKSFALTSNQLEVYFAEKLLLKYPRLKIDLCNPELMITVEVRQESAFIAYESIPGPGGLPSGSTGKVLALLSGGIDSPVACYEMMKRGCRVEYVSFHSSPYTPPTTINKVARLAQTLNQLQLPGRLLAINLLPAQKIIRDQCSTRLRTVLYRRLMMRLSCIAASAMQCQALVTGDNLGQVASQTLTNLDVIDRAATMLVLRPLISANKQDTVDRAIHIGTMDISAEDVPDSCTVFLPPSPTTSAALNRVLDDEDKLNLPELIEQCLQQSYLLDPETLEETELPALTTAAAKWLRFQG